MYSFKELLDYLWPKRDVDGNRIDPEIVTDYRLAAVLLFERWNDGSNRMLRNIRGFPHEIQIRGATSCGGPVTIPVAKDVVESLLKERIVEGTPYWGGADENKLRLSILGRLRVVREFVSDASVRDFFAAGAGYNENREEWFYPEA